MMMIEIMRIRTQLHKVGQKEEMKKDIIYPLICFTDIEANKSAVKINGKESIDVEVIGAQAERASVYGEVLEISFADYKAELYENIRTYDIVNVWIFDKNKLVYMDDPIYKRIGVETRFTLERAMDYVKKNVPLSFSGVITSIQREVSNIAKTNFQAQDFTRLLQNYHIPTKTPYYKEHIKLKESGVTDQTVKWNKEVENFSAVLNFIGKAIIDYASKEDFVMLNAEKKVKIRRHDESTGELIEEEKSYYYARGKENLFNIKSDFYKKVFVYFVFGNVAVIKVHPLLVLKAVYKFFMDSIGLSDYFEPKVEEEKFLKFLEDFHKYTDIDIKNFFTVGILLDSYLSNLNKDNVVDEIKKANMFFNFNDGGNGYVVSQDGILYLVDLTLHTLAMTDPFVVGNKFINSLFFNGISMSAIHVRLSFLHILYECFKNTYNIERLVLDNEYYVRSTRFSKVNKFVAMPVINPSKGLSFIYLVKALIFSSFGIYEPTYLLSEYTGVEKTHDVFNAIRNYVFPKINISKDISDEKKLYIILFINMFSNRINSDYYYYYDKEKYAFASSFINTKAIDLTKIMNIEISRFNKDKTYFLIDADNIKAYVVPRVFFVKSKSASVKEEYKIISSLMGSNNVFHIDQIVENSEIPVSINIPEKTGVPIYPAFFNIGKVYGDGAYMTFTGEKEGGGVITGKYLFFPFALYSAISSEVENPKLLVLPINVKNRHNKISEINEDTLATDNYLLFKGDGETSNIVLTSVIRYINPMEIVKMYESLLSLYKKPRENVIPLYNVRPILNDFYIFLDFDDNTLKHFDFYKSLLEKLRGGKTVVEICETIIDFFNDIPESFWVTRTPVEGFMFLYKEKPEVFDFINHRKFLYLFNKGIFDLEGPETLSLSFIEKTVTILRILLAIFRVIVRYSTQLNVFNLLLSSIYVDGKEDISLGQEVYIIKPTVNSKLPLISNISDKFEKIAKDLLNIDYNLDLVSLLSSNEDEIGLTYIRLGYVWKIVRYIGNSGGTSGFTTKVYISSSPIDWNMNYEEENIITTIAAGLQKRYDLIKGVWYE